MVIVKVQHQKLGEFEVEIALNSIIAIIENNRISCMQDVYRHENGIALRFYSDKKILGTIAQGISIEETACNEIEKAQKEIEVEEANKKYNAFLLKETISYSTSFNFFIPNHIKFSDRACSIVKKILDNDVNIKRISDSGDYSVSTNYKITGLTLLKMLEDAEKEVNEKKLAKEKIEADKTAEIYLKAKTTGEKQLLHKWSESCNDKKEECDIDNLYQYVMPDGTLKTERYHSW